MKTIGELGDTREPQAIIEGVLIKHIAQQGFKMGSKSALKYEATFISGAMNAIQAFFPGENDKVSDKLPVAWGIAAMSGRSIFDMKGKK